MVGASQDYQNGYVAALRTMAMIFGVSPVMQTRQVELVEMGGNGHD